MSSFKKLSALVLVLGLTAAACGSDADEVTEDSTAAESETETTEAMEDEEAMEDGDKEG